MARAGVGVRGVEMIPGAVAANLRAQLEVRTSGTGAGGDCSGQVLVLYDMLGIFPHPPARFVRNFMTGSTTIEAAVAAYAMAVKDGSFPAPEHCF